MTSISTADLRDRLGEPGLTIVDVRPMAAYNGWRLDGEPRGGHIPGAVAFPAAWLATRRRRRDRAPARGQGDHARTRRRRLRRRPARCRRRSPRPARSASGFGDVRTYDAGFPAWAADDGAAGRAPAAATRSSSTSAWLRELLDGGTPERLRRPGYPPLPRQLRGPRGVRRGPSPRRALPRHELARGPGRLEPPLARGDRGDPARARHHRATRRSSCTAATPRATPTRSGRDVGPARSPRRGRR